MEGDEDSNPSEWEKYSVFYMTYFVYEWSAVVSKKVIETKAATELLEMIKEVEFDVIVHDITMPECLHGLWEVSIKNLSILCCCMNNISCAHYYSNNNIT